MSEPLVVTEQNLLPVAQLVTVIFSGVHGSYAMDTDRCWERQRIVEELLAIGSIKRWPQEALDWVATGSPA